MTHDNPAYVKPTNRWELAEALVGKTIVSIDHTKAYGDMDGEIGNIFLLFSDGHALELQAVGHDPDGIGFTWKVPPNAR